MSNQETPCILCGGTDRTVLIRKGSRQIFRCSSCGLGYLKPLPSEAEMASVYDESYFVDQYDKGIPPGTSEFAQRLRLEDHRIRFFKRLKGKGASVLDVGCGNAYFLAACRQKGYRVAGLDISQWAVDYAKGVLGIEVLAGPLDSIDLPRKCFDVVTLWHALEHMRNPREAILKARSWLKEDGVLVVEVPNYEGTDARKGWEDWVGWQIPYHFYHFTPVTLMRLLSECGFRVVKKKTYHSEVVKNTLRRYVLSRPLARLIARCYSGTGVAVAAVPKRV